MYHQSARGPCLYNNSISNAKVSKIPNVNNIFHLLSNGMQNLRRKKMTRKKKKNTPRPNFTSKFQSLLNPIIINQKVINANHHCKSIANLQ